jgi:hypothetical protein
MVCEMLRLYAFSEELEGGVYSLLAGFTLEPVKAENSNLLSALAIGAFNETVYIFEIWDPV